MNLQEAARTHRPPHAGIMALVDEVNHRAANEASVAIAAMRMARSPRDDVARQSAFDLAIGRLEGFADACRILCARGDGPTDIAPSLIALCRALTRSRPTQHQVDLRFDIENALVPPATARIMLVVACELIMNAFKHGIRNGGELRVALADDGSLLVLSVSDGGPGFAHSHVERGRTGQGHRILSQLASDCGGTIVVSSTPEKGSLVTFSVVKRPVRGAWGPRSAAEFKDVAYQEPAE